VLLGAWYHCTKPLPFAESETGLPKHALALLTAGGCGTSTTTNDTFEMLSVILQPVALSFTS
jgi:hypothetical protein